MTQSNPIPEMIEDAGLEYIQTPTNSECVEAWKQSRMFLIETLEANSPYGIYMLFQELKNTAISTIHGGNYWEQKLDSNGKYINSLQRRRGSPNLSDEQYNIELKRAEDQRVTYAENYHLQLEMIDFAQNRYAEFREKFNGMISGVNDTHTFSFDTLDHYMNKKKVVTHSLESEVAQEMIQKYSAEAIRKKHKQGKSHDHDLSELAKTL